MREVKRWFLSQPWINWGLILGIASSLVACGPNDYLSNPTYLNSRYNDEQPALSGNGRFLALVSNRYGSRGILLYDLEQQQLIPLPGLNQRDTIAENPSLSYTGRYLAYVIASQGKPTVAIYDRATQQSQLLTQFYPGWVRHPDISPNGRYVVFEGSSRGQWNVEVIDRGPNIELDIPDSVLPGTSAMPSP